MCVVYGLHAGAEKASLLSALRLMVARSGMDVLAPAPSGDAGATQAAGSLDSVSSLKVWHRQHRWRSVCMHACISPSLALDPVELLHPLSPCMQQGRSVRHALGSATTTPSVMLVLVLLKPAAVPHAYAALARPSGGTPAGTAGAHQQQALQRTRSAGRGAGHAGIIRVG